MKTNINAMLEAELSGYPVYVVINGEYYSMDYGYKTETRNIKNLSELSFDDIKTLLEKDNAFLDKVFNYRVNDADFMVADYLSYFNHYDNNVGRRFCSLSNYDCSYCGTWLSVDENYYTQFLADCVELDSAYCVFSENTKKAIKRAISRVEFWNDCRIGTEDITDDNYNRLNKWINSIIDDAKEELTEFIKQEYDFCTADTDSLTDFVISTITDYSILVDTENWKAYEH